MVLAGSYRLDLAADLSSARLRQGKRTVAEAPCKVGWVQVAHAGTAVHYRTVDGGRDRLIKIVFASSNLTVEFPAAPLH